MKATSFERGTMKLKPAFVFVFVIISLNLMNGFSSKRLTVSTNGGLQLSFSPQGEITEIKTGGYSLPLLERRNFVYVREFTNLLNQENLAPAGDMSHKLEAAGWKKQVKGEAEVVYERNKLIFELKDLRKETKIIYVSPLIQIQGGINYVFSVLVKSDFGYSERAKTPVTGLFIQWFEKGGKEICRSSVEVSGVIFNFNRFTNFSKAPEKAEKARLIFFIYWNPETKVSCNLKNYVLYLKEIYFAKFPPEAEWKPVTGKMRSENGTIYFEGSKNNINIRVKVENEKEKVKFKGLVESKEPVNRAIEIGVSLPVKADGWIWWDDLRRKREIREGEEYFNTVNSLVSQGFLPISLYPISAISNNETVVGLTIDLNEPKIFKFMYGWETGFTCVFLLGFSKKIKNEATFELTVYGEADSEWGLRNIAQHYYKNHKNWFNPELNLTSYTANWKYSEYGLSFLQGSFQYESVIRQAAEYFKDKVYLAQYILPWEYEPVTGIKKESECPSYAETIKIVKEIAENQLNSKAGIALNTHASTFSGDWAIANYKKGPSYRPDEWVPQIPLNTDPEFPGPNVWNYTVETLQTVLNNTKKYGLRINGVELDNFMGRSNCLSLSDKCLEYADISLTYDPNTFKPAIHLSFTAVKYLKTLKEWMKKNLPDSGLTGNYISEGTASFGAIYLDALPFESNNVKNFNWGDKELLYRRFIAGNKSVISVHTELDFNVENPLHLEYMKKYIEGCLFYGIMPTFKQRYARYYDNPNFIEKLGDTLKRGHEIFLKLNKAGWQPLTKAKVSNGKVYVEKFGAGKHFYLTLHNSLDNKEKVEVELETRNLSNKLRIQEIWKNQEINFKGNKFIVEMEGHETLVFEVQEILKQGTGKETTPIFNPETNRTNKINKTAEEKVTTLILALFTVFAVVSAAFFFKRRN